MTVVTTDQRLSPALAAAIEQLGQTLERMERSLDEAIEQGKEFEIEMRALERLPRSAT